MGLGMWELLVILAIVLLIFGGKKLKNLGADLGGAIKNFKQSMKDESPPKDEPPAEPPKVNEPRRIIDAEVVDKKNRV